MTDTTPGPDNLKESPPPPTDASGTLSEDEMALMNAGSSAGADPGPDVEPAPAGGRALVVGAMDRDVAEIRGALEKKGFEVECLKDPGLAGDILAGSTFHLAILATSSSDLKVLHWLRALSGAATSPPVLLAARRPTPSLVFQAVKAGADYVVVLPVTEAALDRMASLTRLDKAA